jgi:hypothetical protein
MLQEGQNLYPGQVFRAQRRNFPLLPLGHETKKQSPRIAVGQYRAMRRVPLLNEPFVKEGMQ